MVALLNKNTKDFITNNPNLNKKVTELTITGKPQAKINMEAVRKLLQTQNPTAIIKVKIDSQYDHLKNGGPDKDSSGQKYTKKELDQSFRVDIKISGIK